jgi:hypothetical protein
MPIAFVTADIFTECNILIQLKLSKLTIPLVVNVAQLNRYTEILQIRHGIDNRQEKKLICHATVLIIK